MNKTRNKIFIYTGLYFACVLIIVTIINRLLWHDIYQPIIAGLILASVLLLTLRSKPLQRYLAILPVPYTAVILVFLFGVLFAQYTRTSHTTFPFLPWHMYTNIPDPNQGTIIKCIGLTENGEEVIINPRKLFGGFAHTRIMTIYNNLVSANLLLNSDTHSTPEPTGTDQNNQFNPDISLSKNIGFATRRIFMKYQEPDSETQKRQLYQLMEAFGNIYNKENPARPIKTVKAVVESFDLRHMSSTKKAQTILQINLSGKP